MRLIVVYAAAVFLSVYAFKDWYKTLCGAIIMMAVLEHPDMPRSIMGIPGMNLMNILLIFIVLSFLINKSSENLSFDPPSSVKILIVLFCCVILISFFRLILDIDSLLMYQQMTGRQLYATNVVALFNLYFLNFKWMLPGFLLFYGCNSSERFVWGELAIAAMIFLLAFQVLKHMPLSSVVNVYKLTTGALKLDRWTGYHRVELASLLSSGVWVYIILCKLYAKKLQQVVLLTCAGSVLVGLLLTGGRGGYLGCFVLALFYGVVKWRKLLFFIPIVLTLIVIFLPTVRDRVYTGISRDPWAAEEVNETQLTAGRAGAWKLTLEQIRKGSFFGFGRLAVHRTGVSFRGLEENKEFFGHPHCAYLEFLLDNGVFGLGIVLTMYMVLLKKGIFLFRSSDSISIVAGGIGLAFIIGQLISSLTALTFYPREDSVLFWCAIGLMLRVYVEKLKVSSHDFVISKQKHRDPWVKRERITIK